MEGTEGRNAGEAFVEDRLAAQMARERRRRVTAERVKENPHVGRLRVGMKMTDIIVAENSQLLLSAPERNNPQE